MRTLSLFSVVIQKIKILCSLAFFSASIISALGSTDKSAVVAVNPVDKFLGHRIVGKDSLKLDQQIDLSNRGSNVISLEFAKTSCGCAVVTGDFPLNIPPGGTVSVQATLNLEGTYGKREATIVFGFSNGEIAKCVLSGSSENLVLVFPATVKMYPATEFDSVKKPVVVSRFLPPAISESEFPRGEVLGDSQFSVERVSREIIKNRDKKTGAITSIVMVDKLLVTMGSVSSNNGEIVWAYSDGIRAAIPIKVFQTKLR